MMNAIHFSWWWSLKSVSSHTAPFRGLLCLAKICCLASKCSWDSAVLSDTWQSCGLRSGEDVRPVSCCFRNHFQVKFRGHLDPRRRFLLAQGHILYLTWKQKEGKKWMDLHDSSSEILFSIGKNTLTHTLVEQHHQLWCLTQFTSGCHANKNQKQPFPLCTVPSFVLMYPHPHC